MASIAQEPDHRPTLAELREALVEWAGRFTEAVWPPASPRVHVSAGSAHPEDATVQIGEPTVQKVHVESGVTDKAPNDSGEVADAVRSSRG